LVTAIGVALLLVSGVALAATFDGTAASDTFVGTPDPDDIRGRGGDDTLSGAGARDPAFAATGATTYCLAMLARMRLGATRATTTC
jgi:hypothetical protein